MKKCPQCGREYDQSMSFCLDDGAELLYGPASIDEPATAILHETAEPGEAATRARIHTTERTAAFQSKDGAEPHGKRFDKRLLLAPVALAVIVLGGFFAYRYFNPAGSSGRISSIAVLPLQNNSGSADSEYLSDGLAESLIYRLSQLPDLKVSSASSVMRYKGQNVDPKKIAAELGVQAVLSGRLLQRGENLSISIELIDAATNNTLWGEQYERKISDLLATQREIAATISDKLQLRISGSDRTGVTKRYTENNEAYQNYLRGRHYWNKRSKEGMDQAIAHFEKAIDLDPTFALAHLGIADCYLVMPSYAYMAPKDAIPRAIAAAKRAMEIDPDLAEAHSAYGSALTYELRWKEAGEALERAIALNPRSAQSHYRYAIEYLAPVGRIDEAIAEIKQALELEPLSIPISANVAGLYIYARRYEDALEQALKTHSLEPGHPTASYWLGWAYVVNGKYAEAISLCEKVLPSQPDNQDLLQIMGYSYAKSGRPEETRRIIARFNEMAKGQYVVAGRIATLYGVLGENDKAFADLERSYEAKDWDFARILIDPTLDSLRADPRFDAFRKKLNLPQ